MRAGKANIRMLILGGTGVKMIQKFFALVVNFFYKPEIMTK